MRHASGQAAGSADSHVIQYRSEIDGLRAVAVVSVVLYHLRAGLLPGGFLGVDIFFVISGYLVTAITAREIVSQRFTFKKFYERRVRRLLPALLTMLAVSFACAVALLLPAGLSDFSKASFSTMAVYADDYLRATTGYFSPDASTRPLLHMWSLSVEEQFYLFSPSLLLLTVKRSRKFAALVVCYLSIGSLALNSCIDVDSPDAAFYYFPARIWELGIGAALALLGVEMPRLPPRLLVD